MKCLICNSEKDIKIIKTHALCSKCRKNIAVSNVFFKERSIVITSAYVSGISMTILSIIVGLLFYIFG